MNKKFVTLFDELEERARFNTMIREVDFKIAEVLNVPQNIVNSVKKLQLEMRRLARVEAKPEALKGSEEFIVKPKKKKKKSKKF